MKRRIRAVRPGDLVVIAVLLLFSAGLTLATLASPRGATAIVLVDGRARGVLQLDQPGTVTVTGPLGNTVVGVDDRGVFIRESPCPQKLCIHMGHIWTRGQALICVPNHVAVRIDSADESSGVDGVTG